MLAPMAEGAQFVKGSYVPVSPFVTLLKTLAILGPNTSKMPMTTMATRTRIKAYSTNPCPCSWGIYISFTRFLLKVLDSKCPDDSGTECELIIL